MIILGIKNIAVILLNLHKNDSSKYKIINCRLTLVDELTQILIDERAAFLDLFGFSVSVDVAFCLIEQRDRVSRTTVLMENLIDTVEIQNRLIL